MLAEESQVLGSGGRWMVRPLLAVQVVLCIAIGIIPCAVDADIIKTTIFTSGEDGYHTYRIPAIIKAANGDLLAFVEGRKNGGGDAGDIDIVMKRSADDGATWSAMQLVQDEWSNPTANVTIGNPSPVVDLLDPNHPGRIWLPFTRNNDRVFVTYSDDHGATWADRREITSTAKDSSWGWYATGPVHGIQLTRGEHAGRLIIPSDHRDTSMSPSGNGAHILYSSDHGETWKIGAVDTHPNPSPIHPNENVAVELVDGRIYVNARSQNGTDPANRAIAYSSNGGITFDAPFVADPQFTTAVVQNSAVRFWATDEGDEQNVLVYAGPSRGTTRNDLTIRFSFDEGTTWSDGILVHEGPAAYSDLVKLNDSQIGVLYEAGQPLYREIIFGTLNYDEFAPFNGVDGDVNQDGVFNAQDLTDFIAAWQTRPGTSLSMGTAERYRNGDLNFDGVVDIRDAGLMRGYWIGLDGSAEGFDLAMLSVPEPAHFHFVAALFLFGLSWRPV